VKSGYLYLISNPAHKGWIKVGVTEDIKARLYVYQTGDPKRQYKVEYYIFHPNCYVAEKRIVELMKPFALSRRKEWYEVDLEIAKIRMDETLEGY
jgi:predicted GIY-YIG superfamily endonuclease